MIIIEMETNKARNVKILYFNDEKTNFTDIKRPIIRPFSIADLVIF
jgi:hypothetical protein